MNDTINGELTITLPDSFKAIEADELERIYPITYPTMRGFRNEQDHIVLTVMWNESNKLAVKLTNAAALAKRAQKNLARANKDRDYHFEGFFDTKVTGIEARGVRYSYTVEGTPHIGEVIIFLRGICCYTLYYYTRAQLASQNESIRNQVLESISLH